MQEPFKRHHMDEFCTIRRLGDGLGLLSPRQNWENLLNGFGRTQFLKVSLDVDLAISLGRMDVPGLEVFDL
eukprot:scaffold76166_cov14-Tisochrysis_lutea.AAC.1